VLITGDVRNTLLANLTIKDTAAAAINITDANWTDIQNNSFESVGWDYLIYNASILTYKFNNDSLEWANRWGRLVFINESLYAAGSNLTKLMNLTNHTVHVNSSIDNGFNTSANITFYGVNFTRPTMEVDFLDNGSFQECTHCVNLSYSNYVFIFNVTKFTTYTVTSGGLSAGKSFTICNATNKCLLFQNSTFGYVTRMDSFGNIDLKGGYYPNEPALTPPAGSFLIENETQVVAYIDTSGTLRSLGAYYKNDTLVVVGDDDLIIENRSGDIVGIIDGTTGNLYFKGKLAFLSSFN
jgi:hypothetical protein